MKKTLLAVSAALVLGSLTMAAPAHARDDTPAAKQDKPSKRAPLQASCTKDKDGHIKVCTLDDSVSGLRFVDWGMRTKEGSQSNFAGALIMQLDPNDPGDVVRDQAGLPIVMANPTAATANAQSKWADLPGLVLGGFANGGLSTMICVLGKCNKSRGAGVNNFIATQANAASVADVDVALANAIAVSPGCPSGTGSTSCPR